MFHVITATNIEKMFWLKNRTLTYIMTLNQIFKKVSLKFTHEGTELGIPAKNDFYGTVGTKKVLWTLLNFV